MFFGVVSDSNGTRGPHLEPTVSTSNYDEESRGGSGSKTKLQNIRHLLGSSKFRNSLSLKKRRSISLNLEKKLVIPIEDPRDEKDLQAVEELRTELIARNKLPSRHDDYHMLLRSVPYSPVWLGLSI